jgi:hypothetical protein
MQGTVRAAVLGTVLAAVLGVSLTACGSTPPSAPAVLKSDGYGPVLNGTQAVIKSSFGSATPYISSVSEGQKSGSLEEVIVGTASGAGFLDTLASEFRSDFSSAKITVTGDILRIIVGVNHE